MSDSRSSGFGMTFLVGGLLILTSLPLFACLAPLVQCPQLASDLSRHWPNGNGKFSKDEIGEKLLLPEINWEKNCAICRGTGKATLLARWIHRNVRARE